MRTRPARSVSACNHLPAGEGATPAVQITVLLAIPLLRTMQMQSIGQTLSLRRILRSECPYRFGLRAVHRACRAIDVEPLALGHIPACILGAARSRGVEPCCPSPLYAGKLFLLSVGHDWLTLGWNLNEERPLDARSKRYGFNQPPASVYLIQLKYPQGKPIEIPAIRWHVFDFQNASTSNPNLVTSGS